MTILYPLLKRRHFPVKWRSPDEETGLSMSPFTWSTRESWFNITTRQCQALVSDSHQQCSSQKSRVDTISRNVVTYSNQKCSWRWRTFRLIVNCRCIFITRWDVGNDCWTTEDLLHSQPQDSIGKDLLAPHTNTIIKSCEIPSISVTHLRFISGVDNHRWTVLLVHCVYDYCMMRMLSDKFCLYDNRWPPSASSTMRPSSGKNVNVPMISTTEERHQQTYLPNALPPHQHLLDPLVFSDNWGILGVTTQWIEILWWNYKSSMCGLSRGILSSIIVWGMTSSLGSTSPGSWTWENNLEDVLLSY